MQRKIRKMTRSLDDKAVYGGRSIIRQITRECNKKPEDMDQQRLQRLRNEFTDKRLMQFVIMGEANQKANRFFDFSELDKGVCYYKPRRGERYKITFRLDRKQKRDFGKLAKLADDKEISITVSLSCDYICFAYDE